MIREFSFWPAIVMATCLLLAGSAGAAGLYKWTDAQGNVHYTQDPPPRGQFQRLTAPPPPPTQAPDKALDKARNSLTPVPPPSADIAADKKRAAEYKKNCEIAKQNLAIYTAHRRIRNAKGQVTTLDDDARRAKIQESQAQVDKFCNQ